MPEIVTTEATAPPLSAHDSHQVYNGLDAGITLEVWHRLREELDRGSFAHTTRMKRLSECPRMQRGALVLTMLSSRANAWGLHLAMMRRGIPG